MKIRKAVIPAAGLGTRFLPATKAVPKEMLPIVDTPVIQLTVEQAVRAGIEHIVIITSAAKRAIENHFDYFFELEYRLEQAGKLAERDQVRRIADLASFSFVRQKQPLGNGHAVLCAREAIGNEPFAVLWGDDLVWGEPPLVSQLAEVYEQYGGSVIAVMRVPPSETGRYGVIAGEQVSENVWRVTDLVEKPDPSKAPSNLACVTGYVLAPEIFETLAATPRGQGGEIWLTDAIRELGKRQPIFACEFSGIRYDAGTKLEYLRATVEFALRDPKLAGPFGEYLREVLRRS